MYLDNGPIYIIMELIPGIGLPKFLRVAKCEHKCVHSFKKGDPSIHSIFWSKYN